MISGFKKYSRFIVERERHMSLIWIASILALTIIVTVLYPGLFPTPQDLLVMAQTMNTPAMIALMGPVYGTEALTPAMVMAQEMSIWVMISVAIMNIFFVNRHTRGDEELGRLEVLRSLPTGRLTNSVSTIVCATALNIVIAVLTAISILIINIDGTTAAGAFAYSFAICAVGIIFAAITLLTAQLFTTARDAMTASFAVLGLFYVLRATGDMSENVFSYISPLGLALKTQSFYNNLMYPIIVILSESIAITAVALVICSYRDLGEGVVPARKGRKHASQFLKSPFGFAWRLTRNILFAWGIGLFVIGAVYGSIIGEIEAFVETNEMFKMMLEVSSSTASLIDSYVTLLFCIMSMLSAVPIVVTVMKIRSEEKRGRLEQIFSKAVPRNAFFACFVLISFVSSVVMLVMGALGLYAASASTGLVPFGVMIKASLVYLPALWAFIGFSVLLVGILQKLTAVIWALFAYSFMMLYFGRILDLPEIFSKLTPFGNIPQYPIQEVTVVPLAVLTIIAVACTAVGMKGFSQRDIY